MLLSNSYLLTFSWFRYRIRTFVWFQPDRDMTIFWPYSVNNVAPSLFSPMIYLYFRLSPWSSHWSSCHHFLLALSRPLLQAPDWHRKWANHTSGTCAPVCRDGGKRQSQTGWDSAAFVNYLEIGWHSDPGSPIKNLLLLLLFQYYSSAKPCQKTITIISVLLLSLSFPWIEFPTNMSALEKRILPASNVGGKRDVPKILTCSLDL
jgi:hypothetical protein